MNGIYVTPVRGGEDLNEFINLPWNIYADSSNWIPPLRGEVRRLLDTQRHPFWQFAERVLFLARRGEEVVGRIAAIVDRNHNRFHNERMGIWGFFECVDDKNVARALFTEAEEWILSQGMGFMRGPLNPSTNYEAGLLVEGFQYAPTIMMTYNLPYYEELVESQGFSREKDLIALIVKEGHQSSQRVERLARRIVHKSNVQIRPLNIKDLETEVALIGEIYTECWSNNWGFVPLTKAELGEMARNLKRFADPDLIFFLYYNDDPAGLGLVLPDINPLLKRLNGDIGLSVFIKIALYRKEVTGLRAMLFGIRKIYQNLGLPLVALDYMQRTGRNKNYQYIELGWNLEDNDAINQFDQEVGGKVTKRYRIYRKNLR
jgi:hypothetical protein